MDLRAYITEVATTFDSSAPMNAPAQNLLRSAPQELQVYAPVGYVIRGSGGAGVPATIPWFGFLNPDETTSPHEGLYVVYLFNADRTGVWLTLIQGITRLHETLRPPRAARERLAADGERLRDSLGTQRLSGWQTSISLGGHGRLPAGYEAGAVAGLNYSIASLPAEAQLRDDLLRAFALYEDAIESKRQLLLHSPGAISTPSGGTSGASANPLDHFAPKDSTDYIARVAGGTFVRTRRHEALIRDYGEWLQAQSLNPTTTRHPIDLVVEAGGTEWVIEGEVVRHGNAAHAVREAIGQLFEYRQFLYTDVNQPTPRLLALFSEDIGDAYRTLLSVLGIEAVWRDGASWKGTSAMAAVGLSE